jgi:hypothetical protein
MDLIRHESLARNEHGVSLRAFSNCLEYEESEGRWRLGGYGYNYQLEGWAVDAALLWATALINDTPDYDRGWIAGAWRKHEDPHGTFWLPVLGADVNATDGSGQRVPVLYRERVPLMHGGDLRLEVHACGAMPNGDVPVHLMTPFGYIPLSSDNVYDLGAALMACREVIDSHNR